MSVEHIVLALVLLLVLSLIAQVVSRRVLMPYASILVLFGFVTSELLVFAGIDTGIRADNFQAIIFYVFIPLLVFEAAYSIDKQALKKNIVVILLLAIVALAITCGITAVVLFYGIGHETGFPWLAAFITASIIAATDPVAVVDKLKEFNVQQRISVLLEGESLFNDAVAIVLFGLFLSMATAGDGLTTASGHYLISDVIWQFLLIFSGGVLTGLAVGGVSGLLQRRVEQPLIKAVMSLVIAYGSYLLAEYLMVSGVMSTLVAGLVYSAFSHPETEAPASGNRYLWEVISHIASVCVFLVVGAVITLEMFEYRWLAMLIAIVAILVARALSIYGVLLLVSFFRSLKVPLAEQTVMVWGGLRGAVTLALALSLPTSLDYWWTIQSIAFGVVMFSLFIQAPTMKPLAMKLISTSK